MIKIKEPRYRDRRVLVARYRIPTGGGVTIEILKGAYKGLYKATNDTICSSPIETMRTRNGANISMRAISLDELERIENMDRH